MHFSTYYTRYFFEDHTMNLLLTLNEFLAGSHCARANVKFISMKFHSWIKICKTKWNKKDGRQTSEFPVKSSFRFASGFSITPMNGFLLGILLNRVRRSVMIKLILLHDLLALCLAQCVCVCVWRARLLPYQFASCHCSVVGFKLLIEIRAHSEDLAKQKSLAR